MKQGYRRNLVGKYLAGTHFSGRHFLGTNWRHGVCAAMVMCLIGISGALRADDIEHYHPFKVYDAQFYVESNLEFTLLHELAHAVIDHHQIPVLGGQEQAADQIAVMLLILMHDGLDPQLLDRLLAVSADWMIQWQMDLKNQNTVFWDVHPLPIQRFYEVTCLAYGSNPDVLESLRKDSWLPIERAWDCDLEFKENQQALAWLATKVSHYQFDPEWKLKRVSAASDSEGQVNIHWTNRTKGEQPALYQSLKNSTRLKRLLASINDVLKLKNDIPVYIETMCAGPDAWWNSKQNIVIICYELLEQFADNSTRVSSLIDEMKTVSARNLIVPLTAQEAAFINDRDDRYSEITRLIKSWLKQKLAE